MKKILLLILPLLMLVALPRVHGAERTACLARSVMIDTLIAEYGEQLAEVRDIKGKGLLEFHVSPKDGTWTALLTNPSNYPCSSHPTPNIRSNVGNSRPMPVRALVKIFPKSVSSDSCNSVLFGGRSKLYACIGSRLPPLRYSAGQRVRD